MAGEQSLVHLPRHLAPHALDRRELPHRLLFRHRLEPFCRAHDPAGEPPGPPRILRFRHRIAVLHRGAVLELLQLDRHPAEESVRVELGAGDVVDDLPALVTVELPHPGVPHVDVIAPPAAERDQDRVLAETEVRDQVLVHDLDDLGLDLLEHRLVRHPLHPLDVVRVEVEDEVRPEPLLLLHRRCSGLLIVRAREVHVHRCPAGEEVPEGLATLERLVALHHPSLPEHEPELAPGEPRRELEVRRLVVPAETVPDPPDRCGVPFRRRGHGDSNRAVPLSLPP